MKIVMRTTVVVLTGRHEEGEETMEKLTARIKSCIDGNNYDVRIGFAVYNDHLMEVDLGNLIGCFQEMNGRSLMDSAKDYITTCYGDSLLECTFI